MITKTTLALALILGSTSVALSSEVDPNLLNRYPAFNMTQHFGGAALQTRNIGLTSGAVVKSVPQSWIDRASFSTGQ